MIVAEGGSFPTDLYVTEGVGVAAGRGGAAEGRDGADLLDLIDEDVAVVLVNQVDYRSGESAIWSRSRNGRMRRARW